LSAEYKSDSRSRTLELVAGNLRLALFHGEVTLNLENDLLKLFALA
jgi:hypothetical protein